MEGYNISSRRSVYTSQYWNNVLVSPVDWTKVTSQHYKQNIFDISKKIVMLRDLEDLADSLFDMDKWNCAIQNYNPHITTKTKVFPKLNYAIKTKKRRVNNKTIEGRELKTKEFAYLCLALTNDILKRKSMKEIFNRFIDRTNKKSIRNKMIWKNSIPYIVNMLRSSLINSFPVYYSQLEEQVFELISIYEIVEKILANVRVFIATKIVAIKTYLKEQIMTLPNILDYDDNMCGEFLSEFTKPIYADSTHDIITTIIDGISVKDIDKFNMCLLISALPHLNKILRSLATMMDDDFAKLKDTIFKTNEDRIFVY
uniref:Uncharacterized protein n=1 Tax=viral metagenome TaxID=1070528 RepID=A0A6C0ECM6_9ZZZZ